MVGGSELTVNELVTPATRLLNNGDPSDVIQAVQAGELEERVWGCGCVCVCVSLFKHSSLATVSIKINKCVSAPTAIEDNSKNAGAGDSKRPCIMKMKEAGRRYTQTHIQKCALFPPIMCTDQWEHLE